MKLSDIKGERTFDVIAELIDPIANIASDDAVSRMFKRETCPEGVDPRKFMADRMRKSIPYLLKDHRSDIIDIMSCLKGVPRDEYVESLNMVSLVSDLVELMSDEEFISFLS